MVIPRDSRETDTADTNTVNVGSVIHRKMGYETIRVTFESIFSRSRCVVVRIWSNTV